MSVVVPVLDEAGRIGARLAELARLGLDEVLVVDGGSRDDTVGVARAGGARVLHAPAGRAGQMNRGASAARGDVLLFLHADVALPDDALDRIREVLADPGVVAGAFRTRTVNDGPPSWVDPLLPMADVRASYTRLPYGDQALFVRREAFERAGGFPEQPLFEDLEMSRRLWRLGRVAIAPSAVRVSGRRFVARPFTTTLIVNTFPVLYRLGVSADRLARLVARIR